MKNKILQEFLNSNLKIKSPEKLEQYIQFCLKNNYGEKIKYKTSYHHILPKAESCFPEYKNLKIYSWNGSHLYYADHYYAHWLLSEAIDDYSILSSFCAMHNTDVKNGRIEENNLIPPDKFQKKMEESYSKRKEIMEKVEENGKTKQENALIKRNKTMDNTFINGKSKRKIASDKRLDTINLKENGKKISKALNKKDSKTGKTIAKLRGEKFAIQYTKEIIIDGVKTTKAKEQGKRLSEKLIAKGKFFKIIKDDLIIVEKISEKDMRNMSRSLIRATKDKPLGATPSARATMIRFGKEDLINCYSIQIDKGI